MIYPIIKGAEGAEGVQNADGSGRSHTPVEAKESGRSRQQLDIVEVISEGEIYGLVNDMKSIYLDKTPVANPNGSFNFKNLSFQARVGTQNQSPMNGFNTAQREIAVGVAVKKDKPITKTVTDKNVTSLRITVGVSALVQREENGDTNGSSVDLQIRIGNRVYPHNFTGKYTAGTYLEMLEIYDLPTPPFNIVVERLTPDSTSQRLQNGTVWASYTEITNDNFAYPNTALMGVSIDSDYFQSQPQRNYLIRGLIINVPDIYNPFTRTYSSDFWNGTFKKAWTNNPVWIWHDLVTNKRYGLGKSIADFNVDVFQLFAIAKYCDELVPDGFGGKEPRMTCNAWITDQREAYDLIQSLSSVFRAMPIWNGQYLTAVQDRVADPVWTYNNSNVVEGVFTYSRSARKARHNTIQVEWVNPDDFYNTAIEQVTDDDSVKRFGQNISKVTAFGCTSRGQAYRTGRWILETEKLETETVTFTVGAEGLMHLPYDIIEVADNQFAGINVGGRVLSAIANKVELDRPIEFDSKTYLSYINKQGEFKRTKVMGFDKKTNTVTLDQAVGDIQELAVWSLETSKVATGLYRCTAIVENEDGTFNITALQHVPQKEDIVINGTHFDPKPRTVYSALENITVDYDGRTAVIKGHTNGLDNTGNEEITYDIRILKNGAVISNKLGLKSPSYSMEDLEDGEYTVIITSKDRFGRIISVKEYNFVIDKPPVVGNPSAIGGLGCIYLSWDYVNEITDTEIWASKTDDLSTAKLITRMNGLMYTYECGGNETWYFWLRHVRGMNVGSFGQATGIQATSEDSLDDIKQLQAKIAEQVVTVALPARKLDMTLTVDDIGNPAQYRGHKQVYNEADGKLYTWNGSMYQSGATELLASAIKGKITPDQLVDIPSSKITGTLQANQISGALSIAQIPNIPTSKLSGTIGANLFQANSIGANIIQTGAIGANHLQANSVGATQLQANSVGANAIQANAIGADQIQANSINSAKIQVGAIRANHIASDQITADKLAIGVGGNILPNPLFANNAEGWHGFVYFNDLTQYWTSGSSGVEHLNLTYRSAQNYRPTDSNYINETFNFARWSVNDYARLAEDSKNNRYWVDNARVLVNVIPDKTYIFSAYVGCHHCGGYLIAEEYSANGKDFVRWLGNSDLFGERDRIYVNDGEAFAEASSYHFENGVDMDKAHRAFVKFKAPQSGVVCLIFRIHRFGYKQAYQDNYMARAMLEQVPDNQNAPSKWRETSITAIDGGSIVANTISGNKIRANSITGDKIVGNTIAGDKIVAGSITGDRIAGNTITGDKIQANSITGDRIAGNTITGDKIVARSISSDKLNVGSLSAISSNIGRINAGDITGVNIHGNNINGNNISGGSISATTIHGTNINGGTIRGARLEGVTGKFTGSLEVNQLIGGNLCEVFVANVRVNFIGSDNDRTGFYTTTIYINPSPVKRIVFIVNSDISFIVNANERKEYYYSKTSKGGHPPEIFNFNGGKPNICISAYAVSDTRTIYQ